MVYCIIPSDLAAELHETLREFFREDSNVQVVVDFRRSERRAGQRRGPSLLGTGPAERRAIRASQGRRVAERRTSTLPAAPPRLPAKTRRFAERLRFVERVTPSRRVTMDTELGRAAVRGQGGDPVGLEELYLLSFDGVYNFLRVLLRDAGDAERATQAVFSEAFRSLADYEPRRHGQVRAWLYRIARDRAVAQLGRGTAADATREIPTLRRRGSAPTAHEAEVAALVSDALLVHQIERLPLSQRQALTLRYLADLEIDEIASILDTSPDEVIDLERRALTFLQRRLASAGRGPEDVLRIPARARRRVLPVLSARASALK